MKQETSKWLSAESDSKKNIFEEIQKIQGGVCAAKEFAERIRESNTGRIIYVPGGGWRFIFMYFYS